MLSLTKRISLQLITQGRSNQPSEGSNMTLQGGDLASRFDLKNAPSYARKMITSHQQRAKLARDFSLQYGFLWGAAKTRGDYVRERIRREIKQIWVPRIHLAKINWIRSSLL
ncbi:hypothetical protein O6H91_19G000500 [Diphasiastrum complanatum]|uniref:Uncharacterized protein n=1 Tax=Diphasiastrum complanatum TaxID=34168 RepID=A0ACC2AS23_DIPCM|nr:hypothetical protein O6H91_19G000500 [Diphasiastrum complanatum]